MRLGVCWYPEQWPEETWAPDAALMASTGLELVRIGEFAWSRMEPARDQWDWSWLDRVIATLVDAGLEVVLGTPSATPPIWLMRERPEILSVGPDGRRRAWGSRRHTCPTSPAYREEALRIATAMADRYGDHEGVTAWQVDNEPGNHDSARCWCDACQSAFSAWLEERFADIAALNEAWGTTFWSMTYDTFDDVRLPVPTMTRHNPALDLAHLAFASDQAVAGLAQQREAITARSPGRPTFTNLYIGDVDVDGQAVGRLHDLGAMDSYPHGVSGPEEVAFLLDHVRGTSLRPGEGVERRGGRGWVVEQQPGAINWTPLNPGVPEGQVRLWGWQAAMHGIEALFFFRWRAARAGQEQYHTGLLRHDGTPDQGLAEASRLATELREVAPELLERPPARVALVYGYRDAWAMDLDPHREGLTHRQLVVAAHAGVRRLGLDVDVVPDDADLTGYELVLAPALHRSTPERLGRLTAVANAGAMVVLGPRSLVKDDENAWVGEPFPHGLTARLGAHVVDWGSTATWPAGGPEPEVEIVAGGQRAPGGPWADVIEVTGQARVVARWRGTHRDGRPAAVVGDGVALVGASSADAWASCLSELLELAAGPANPSRHLRSGTVVEIDHVALDVRLGPST